MHRETKLVRVDQDQFVPSQGQAAALVSRLCTLQREFCSRCNVKLLHRLGFNGIPRAKPLASWFHKRARTLDESEL